jgi:hypothetical protein
LSPRPAFSGKNDVRLKVVVCVEFTELPYRWLKNDD